MNTSRICGRVRRARRDAVFHVADQPRMSTTLVPADRFVRPTMSRVTSGCRRGRSDRTSSQRVFGPPPTVRVGVVEVESDLGCRSSGDARRVARLSARSNGTDVTSSPNAERLKQKPPCSTRSASRRSRRRPARLKRKTATVHVRRDLPALRRHSGRPLDDYGEPLRADDRPRSSAKTSSYCSSRTFKKGGTMPSTCSRCPPLDGEFAE